MASRALQSGNETNSVHGWSRRRGCSGAMRVHDISTRVSVYIARARGDHMHKKHARDRSRFLWCTRSASAALEVSSLALHVAPQSCACPNHFSSAQLR